ncbi:CHASE3 domain-containing protein [bacterium]|nr:CHASE3 domain-containing protein [bacterium]MBP9811063.1 CHASE3 domain-containing protein [bacterium]
MKLSLSLRFKGLLAVLLLLAMELLFVGCHAWLLQEAERESIKQETAKEVIARATDMLQLLYDAGDSVAKYLVSHDPEGIRRYEQARQQIPEEIRWIKEHIRDDKNQFALLEKIEISVTAGLSTLAEMRAITDKEAQFVAMQYAVKLRAKVQKNMEGLINDLIDFLDTEKKIESASPRVLQAQRDMIRYLLLAGVALNIGVAIALALLFTRSIASRLTIVEDNSLRLRQRKPLRAPLSGDDEIALLDQAFHKMSHSLRGEEALVLASEEQVQTIIDQMPIGLAIIQNSRFEKHAASSNAVEEIEYANPTLEKMLGYKSGAMVGTKVASHFLIPGPKPTPLQDSSQIEGVIELIAATKDQRQIPVEFSVTDVSLDRLAEQNKQLAAVIDITEKREIEKMKEAFLAMVSHDLRTPLTSVAGFLHMLPMGVYGELNAAIAASTKVAEDEVEHLIALINDLLDLEKLRAGQLDMNVSQFDLEDAIDASVDATYSQADDGMVSVIFEGCEGKIAADQERLQQAITKTLEALLRLCEHGDTITITVTMVSANLGKAYTISLSSEKLVLQNTVLSNLFEPFQPIELPSGSLSLGLRLPLAQAIMLSHGGTCGASQHNGVLLLWLTLPC